MSVFVVAIGAKVSVWKNEKWEEKRGSLKRILLQYHKNVNRILEIMALYILIDNNEYLYTNTFEFDYNSNFIPYFNSN